MIDSNKVIFYLDEEKEENRLNPDWFPPPPLNGYTKGMTVTIDGQEYKIKDDRKREDGYFAVILEEID